MIALVGILLLCVVVLLLADFLMGFVFNDKHRAAVWLCGFGVCAALLVGFFLY